MKSDKIRNNVFRFTRLVGGLITLILVYSVIDWGFLKGEVTSYPIICWEGSFDLLGKCSSGKVGTLNRKNYIPNETTQSVIYWLNRGEGKELLSTLKKCTVVSRKDWECSYNDGSGSFGFKGGKYWEDTDYKDTKHTSKFEYMLTYWKSVF